MVNVKATEKEITQAYHRLGLVYHPLKTQNEHLAALDSPRLQPFPHSFHTSLLAGIQPHTRVPPTSINSGFLERKTFAIDSHSERRKGSLISSIRHSDIIQPAN